MKLRELLVDVAVCTPLPENGEQEVTGLTGDSRKVTPGTVFVCLKGSTADGHDFAAQAVKKGALLVIAEHPCGVPDACLVPDTAAAFVTLCDNWFSHPLRNLRLIGVTGTNGKTTTTYLLKELLEQVGHKVGLIGTIENRIGELCFPSHNTTPGVYELRELFARMVEAGCAYAVMEVSSHALSQGRVAGCFFDAAIFTNLTQDHLDYHGTMERYFEAKKKLFSQCGCAVINVDDAWASRMQEGLTCPVVTVSAQNREATYTAHGIVQQPDGVQFELMGAHAGQIGRVRLAIPGLFSVHNALGAAGAALSLGVPFEAVIRGLCEAKGVKGRAEIVPTGRDFTVVIDYAHTPDGLYNICQTLNACKKGRLVTVFGCGGDRDRTKRPKMGAVAAQYSDAVVITSDNPRSEEPCAIIEDILAGMHESQTPYRVIESRPEAIAFALRTAQPGDTVLLAGKGHETYQILKSGTIHLDEREVIQQVLAGDKT